MVSLVGQAGESPQTSAFSRIPAELRDRPQWCLAGPDKRPMTLDGRPASATDRGTWADFDNTCRSAAERGCGIGYVLTADDPFACIDMDVKDDTPPEALERYQSIIDTFDSYTERSRSGRGTHVWVRGNIGKGRRKDGVEVYSQERFIICTGDVVRAQPIADRQPILDNIVSRMTPPAPEVLLTGGDVPNLALAERASADTGELGRLFRGEWSGRYETQSEADLALARLLLPLCGSLRECWATFRLSELGKREKAARPDYMRSTLALASQHVAKDAASAKHGAEVAAALLKSAASNTLTSRSGDLGVSPSKRQLVGRPLGGIAPRSIEWLWRGWIPKGYITIFAGETGAGKSTVLADVTARVTTGAPWPGDSLAEHRKPGRVLWLGSEDSIEEMTVPRLLACGANLDNVIEIQCAMQEGQRGTFSMQDDLDGVAEWLAYARDVDGHPFAMLVIDPVTSYLPGQKLRKVDLNDAGQLRTVLEPWLILAQKYHVAIVCVTHFAKDTNRSMLHRVLGSAAFAQTCRSLCAVVEPPSSDDDEPGPFEKALLQVKVNLPEHPGGAWRFSTEVVEVGSDERSGKPITATRPNWEQLDGALTPKTAVGRSRGPKSQIAAPFALWVNFQFNGHPPGTWLPADTIKWTAIREGVASESWWNKHSPEYLEKDNQNGTWMCRLRQVPDISGILGELGKVV